MAAIPNQRQIHTSLLVSRPDGVTWVDVAPYLSRVTAERGDVTRVGVGGADGVLNLLKFDLHNDGAMMPSWRDNIVQDESYVVGDEEDDVGDEAESAATLIDLLFGAEHRYERDPFQPTDRNSAWNRNSNDEYEPLLASYREVALFLATTPIGEQPEPEDWHCPFHGYLGKRISTNGSVVSCEAKSLSKRLQDTLIETEQTYGSEEGTPAEEVIQQILDANLGPGEVTLYCPVPSGSMVYPYTFKDGSVWDKIQEIAGKSGWFLGDRWDPVTKQFRLTFMEPPIDKDESTADYHFTWTDDFHRQELDITDEHYRNAVIVEYWDEAAKEVRTVKAEKPEPIRRAMKIGLGKTPLIRTEAEAQHLADMALHDMSNDTVVCRVTMPLFPELDTFDGVVIENPHVSSTKDFFGVESVRHELDFNTGRFVTEFIGSGKVVGGRQKWIKMQTRPGAYLPTSPEDVTGGGIVMPKPVGVSARGIIRGVAIDVPAPPVNANRWKVTEVHLSTTQGFTPSENTLVAAGRETHFEITDDGTAPLVSGTKYYMKTRYVDMVDRAGLYSDEVSAVAGKVTLGDILSVDADTIIQGILDADVVRIVGGGGAIVLDSDGLTAFKGANVTVQVNTSGDAFFQGAVRAGELVLPVEPI